MKNYVWLLSIIFFTATCSSQPLETENIFEGKWNLLFTHDDVGSVRTYMNVEISQNTFISYTRKGADKDIFGGWTSLLSRVFTNTMKEGTLLRIENGVWEKVSDTIKVKGVFTSPIGNYYLNGIVIDKRLEAELTNKTGKKIGFISGDKRHKNYPLEDYTALFEKTIEMTEKYIYDAKLVKSKEWKVFKSRVLKISPKIQDDLEAVFAFYYYAGKLPFSHYGLLRNTEDVDYTVPASQKKMKLLEKNDHTAYWELTSFGGSATEIDSTFEIIKNKGYKNLIVDLRNNTGGSIEAGLAFVNQLAEEPYYGGVFLTRKYFDNHKQLPDIKNYSSFLNFSSSNYDLLLKGIHKNGGICLKADPVKNRYKGKVFILVSHKTASTSEPVVYGLKHNKRAIIVGEKTAGAMLNSEFFDLGNQYQLMIPTADYYTVDGFRIDQNGVKPDIEVNQSEALEYVLNSLIQQ